MILSEFKRVKGIKQYEQIVTRYLKRNYLDYFVLSS